MVLIQMAINIKMQWKLNNACETLLSVINIWRMYLWNSMGITLKNFMKHMKDSTELLPVSGLLLVKLL